MADVTNSSWDLGASDTITLQQAAAIVGFSFAGTMTAGVVDILAGASGTTKVGSAIINGGVFAFDNPGGQTVFRTSTSETGVKGVYQIIKPNSQNKF